jgi:tRNA threonylcarbamoyladenosine biosynthesis protein TsaE
MDGHSAVIELPDHRATRQLGERLGEQAPPGTVLLLSGDLGSGKTTLVQGVGAGLGITEPISSPTFTLVNEYLEGRIPLYHVDLYRLNPAEVTALYLDRYWDEQETAPGLVAIEWCDRLIEVPPPAISLSLAYGVAGGRQATLKAATHDQITLLETVLGHGLLVDEV